MDAGGKLRVLRMGNKTAGLPGMGQFAFFILIGGLGK